MIPFFSEKWKRTENWMKSIAFPAIQNALFKNLPLEKPIYKILCVDDDQSFCLFIQRLGRSLGIQVDAVYSFEQAKQAIEHSQYQAFIIDGHLPDGSGFELVAWIREKKELNIPIGFISRIYHDAVSFRILKDSLKVDYVLEKPIRPSEVHQLLIQLSPLKSGSLTQKPFSDHLFAELKETYKKTIPDKIERLENIILAIQKSPTIENLQGLRIEVHKIAGSAGSYGFTAVGEICKNLELELIKQMKLAKQGLLNPQWLFSLDDFFTQIKLHFQIEDVQFGPHHALKPRYFSSVYVISENQTYLETLIASKQDFDFNILVESRPDRAIQTLLSADFYPQIFLLDAHYQTSILNGYDLVKGFYQKKDALTTTIGMSVEKDNVEQQEEALQRGMTFITEKPFSPALIFSFLDQIPFRAFSLHYKILVIDESTDTCQYILKSLKYTGLEIKILQDFNDLHAILFDYQPDLILLDIHLIDESGIRILEYLRDKLRYKKLLIGMLTIRQDETYLIQKSYEFNVDEILFKPLEAGFLQKKIAYLLKRQVNRELSEGKDALTELESTETFKCYLEKLEDQFRVPFPKILSIFEVKDFSSINQDLKKEIIIFISRALEDLLKKYEMATYLGNGRFALIFQGYDHYFVRLFILSFLERLESNLQKTLIQSGEIQIHGTTIVFSKGKKQRMF